MSLTLGEVLNILKGRSFNPPLPACVSGPILSDEASASGETPLDTPLRMSPLAKPISICHCATIHTSHTFMQTIPGIASSSGLLAVTVLDSKAPHSSGQPEALALGYFGADAPTYP